MNAEEPVAAAVLAVSAALCSVAEHLDQCNYADAAEALLEPAGGLRRLMAQAWDEGLAAGAQWTPTQWGSHVPVNPHHAVECRALRQAPHGDALWTVDRRVKGGYDHYDSQHHVEVIRPLVVIDPEDEQAVASLVAALHWDTDPSDIPATWRAQAALREFANPKPPKPEEPLGLGAVVLDDDGLRWVRVQDQNCAPWIRTNSGYSDIERPYRYFKDITAVKVLSEGVTA